MFLSSRNSLFAWWLIVGVEMSGYGWDNRIRRPRQDEMPSFSYLEDTSKTRHTESMAHGIKGMISLNIKKQVTWEEATVHLTFISTSKPMPPCSAKAQSGLGSDDQYASSPPIIAWSAPTGWGGVVLGKVAALTLSVKFCCLKYKSEAAVTLRIWRVHSGPRLAY